MSEKFDVVNFSDEVVDLGTRYYVHREKLLHRAVHVMILNSSNKWILQQRSKSKDIDPLLWTSSCSGHVDSGEDYINAAVRECREELIIDVKPGSLYEVFRSSPCLETDHEFVRFYFLEFENVIKFNVDEIVQIKECSINEIENQIEKNPQSISESFKHLFPFVQKRARLYERSLP